MGRKLQQPGGSPPVVTLGLVTDSHGARRVPAGRYRRDYSHGGYFTPLSTPEAGLSVQRRAVGDYALYRLTASQTFAVRRTWSHVREDGVDVVVFWFVRRGRLVVSSPGAAYTVEAGGAAITTSSRAQYMELRPEEERTRGAEAGPGLEAIRVEAPAHALGPASALAAGAPLPASPGAVAFAGRVLALLLEPDEAVDPVLAEPLLGGLLTGLARAIAPPADPRLVDIVSCINQNFAHPGLDARTVADACGLSPRRLFQILARNGQSFSALLWERRLETACEWLKDERMRRQPATDIARRLGFKTSTHFSRMFKARYGLPPHAFRRRYLEPPRP